MFPIPINNLLENLRSSTPVYFSYEKKDGTMRDALGTLNFDLIPEEFRPKDSSEGDYKESTNIRYFDIDKQGWRSISNNAKTVFILE